MSTEIHQILCIVIQHREQVHFRILKIRFLGGLKTLYSKLHVYFAVIVSLFIVFHILFKRFMRYPKLKKLE